MGGCVDMKASKDSLESLRTQGCAYSSNIWMRNCAPFSLSTDVRGQGKSGCLSNVYGLEIRAKTIKFLVSDSASMGA